LRKLGSLTIQIVTIADGKAIANIDGKAYKLSVKELEDLKGLADVITEIKIEGNNLVYKAGVLEGSIPLEPL